MSPTSNILYPEPPLAEDEIYNSPTFVPGKFEYVKDINRRTMLVNTWEAITLTESWDFVRQKIESFSMSSHPKISIILNKMKELGYNGKNTENSCSFGVTMREMQFIAQMGEKEYIKHILLSENCTNVC